MNEIHVNIAKNTRVQSIKKRLRVDKKETFESVLTKVSYKLGIDAKVLYNQEGIVIDDAGDFKDGETLYASQGEQFWQQNKVTGSVLKTEERTKVLKLGIIGPPSVGKSALTVRYTQKIFYEEYLPSFESLFKKSITLDGEQVEIDILDSSGLDELVVMRPNWFKEREAFIMVYAINNRGSFEALNVFYEQLVTFRTSSDVPLILVGNKLDMEQSRQVSREEGMKVAKSFNAEFYETSAKKDMNVTQIFEAASKKLFAIKYKPAVVPVDREKKCSCTII